MTDPHDRHGEVLRRLLHAEAAKIEPAPDGLERIRAGAEQRRARRLRSLYGWSPARFWLPGGWSRPVLAVAVTVLIVALGVSAPQTIDRITSAGRHGPTGDGGSVPTATTGPGSTGQAGRPPAATGPGQPTAPAPGESMTTPVPGVGGAPPCNTEDDQVTAETPTVPDPSATVPPAPSPCPTPSETDPTDPSTGDPSSPGTTEDPQTPDPGDPSTPAPSPAPGDTTAP